VRVAPEALSLSAEELSAAFVRGAEAAALRVKDRPVRVSGVVTRIDLNLGGPEWQTASVYLRGAPGEKKVGGVGLPREVLFWMKERGPAARLGPGQAVTLEGAYATTVLGEPTLRDGAVVRAGPVRRSQGEIERLKREEPQVVAALKKLGVDTNGTVTTLTDDHLTAEGHIQGAVLTQLRRLPTVPWLILDGTKVTDEGLGAAMRRLCRVERLNLQETRVTDAALADLADHVALLELRVERTAVTEAGVRRLQRALPALKVWAD
jgi:hypothetical protein